MIQVYRIDENGFYIEPVAIESDAELPSDCVENPIQEGLFRPKWLDGKWIEGLSQEEIDAINNALRTPTEIELLRLEMARGNTEMFETMLALMGGV